MKTLIWKFALSALFVTSACGDGDLRVGAPDGGLVDGGGVDGAIEDSGPSGVDAEAPGEDTTSTPDTGTPTPSMACDRSFVHQGYDGCESMIDGLQVKFFPLADGVQVEHLVVFFHGDTGNGWFENFGFRRPILEWARARNMLVVAPLATSSYDGDDLPAYGAAQRPQAEEVTSLLENVIDTYGASTERTYYWGVSGGSWFLASSYIAHSAERIPGIYVANCGGSGRSFGWQWDPETDTAVRDSIAAYFSYGSRDFLAERAHNSFIDFGERGITTDERVFEGATHCDHPIAEPTVEFWERHR